MKLAQAFLSGAIVCFVGTAFVGANVFFMMESGILQYGGPPSWLAYGILASLWLLGLSGIIYAVELLREFFYG